MDRGRADDDVAAQSFAAVGYSAANEMFVERNLALARAGERDRARQQREQESANIMALESFQQHELGMQVIQAARAAARLPVATPVHAIPSPFGPHAEVQPPSKDDIVSALHFASANTNNTYVGPRLSQHWDLLHRPYMHIEGPVAPGAEVDERPCCIAGQCICQGVGCRISSGQVASANMCAGSSPLGHRCASC